MPTPFRSSANARLRFRPGLAFVLLIIMLGVVWVAGGASRADAIGQVVVRATAWTLLFVMILFGDRPTIGPVRPVLWLVLAAVLLPLAQLMPLPPGIWQAMPGHAMFAEAATASGQPQPWRPWSIVPGATLNAASSLIVPFVVLILACGLRERERAWLPGLLLGMMVASMLLGLLQFAGNDLNNPFVNDTPGQVSANFANRNHFALFLALGCVLTPVWAFLNGRQPGWRGPVALALVLLFVLTILASGSRAGLGLGMLALAAGGLLIGRNVRRILRRYPRWVSPALIAGVLVLVAVVVVLSVVADRAVSIDRMFAADQGQDMRVRGLPTVLEMVRVYFPFGSGLGGFDPIFRIHEPFHLLKLTYFNHAHNDLLEVALDAGLPGMALMVAAIGWWTWASAVTWRSGPRGTLAQSGSVMVMLILIASLVDYPVRTPIMMAVTVIVALWLGRGTATEPASVPPPALPPQGQHL